MKFKKFMNSRALYIILFVVVVLEIITAGISAILALEPTQRDAGLSNLFLGVLVILLFILPYLIEKRLRIHIPNYLKSVISIFFFASLILGNIHGFLEEVNGYDKFLHVLSGIIISIIGFEIVNYLSKTRGKALRLSPGLMSIFAFTFSITLLVLWEFYEFFVDTIAYNYNIDTERNMQRYQWANNSSVFPQGYGLLDTMLDLIVGFLGASLVSIIGWRVLVRQQLLQLKSPKGLAKREE